MYEYYAAFGEQKAAPDLLYNLHYHSDMFILIFSVWK